MELDRGSEKIRIEPPHVIRSHSNPAFNSRRASVSGYDAVAMLHEATHGCLRDIDRFATCAMRVAARRKKKLVERDTLASVIEADSRDA